MYSFSFHFIYLFLHFLFFKTYFDIFLPVGEIYLESLCYYDSACSEHVLFILFDSVHNLI